MGTRYPKEYRTDVDVNDNFSLKIGGVAVTATAAELNALDGITATVAELNTLDGITAVVAELNILDGVTADATELNTLDGITAVVAELNILDGATVTVAEINVLDDIPASVTFAYAAGGSNVSEVTITVKDAAGVAIAEAFNLDVYLSDAATGVGLTGTTASGTVQAKSASGADLETVTAKKHLRVQTLATGIYILEITDSAKTGFYPCAIVPGTGKTAIGAQMVSGDYGA